MTNERFSLTFLPLREAFALVSGQTNDYQVLDPEFAVHLFGQILTRKGAIYGSLPAPADKAVNAQVIGHKGTYFRYTTENCDVYFIWHDRIGQRYIFLGEHIGVVSRAMKVIRNRIDQCSARIAAGVQAVAEVEADAEVEAVAGVEGVEGVDAFDLNPLVDSILAGGEEGEEGEDEASCFNCMVQNTDTMFFCSKCQVATYCGRACQKADWLSHKSTCTTSE